MRKPMTLLAAASVAAILAPGMAQAYIGPGLGVGAITAIFGVVAAVFMSLIALVWYPVKRLVKRGKPAQAVNLDEG